jgi:hypothetical protein
MAEGRKGVEGGEEWRERGTGKKPQRPTLLMLALIFNWGHKMRKEDCALMIWSYYPNPFNLTCNTMSIARVDIPILSSPWCFRHYASGIHSQHVSALNPTDFSEFCIFKAIGLNSQVDTHWRVVL